MLQTLFQKKKKNRHTREAHIKKDKKSHLRSQDLKRNDQEARKGYAMPHAEIPDWARITREPHKSRTHEHKAPKTRIQEPTHHGAAKPWRAAKE
jgi:hypothetical protein